MTGWPSGLWQHAVNMPGEPNRESESHPCLHFLRYNIEVMNLYNLTSMFFPYPLPDGQYIDKEQYRVGELPPIFYVETYGIVVAISPDHVELNLNGQITAYAPLSNQNVYESRVYTQNI